MIKISKDTELAKDKLIDLIVPEGMTPKQRDQLADKAGVNKETLRHLRRKRSMNADTLLRLLLARGVALRSIVDLPQNNVAKLSKAERLWLELGRELDDIEKTEYVGLLKYFRSKFSVDK